MNWVKDGFIIIDADELLKAASDDYWTFVKLTIKDEKRRCVLLMLAKRKIWMINCSIYKLFLLRRESQELYIIKSIDDVKIVLRTAASQWKSLINKLESY